MDINKLNRPSKQYITTQHYSAWKLIKAYWQSEFRTSAYLFLLGIVLLTVAMVGLDVGLSYWSNYFYNALQAYDKRSVIYLLFVFCGLAAVYILIAVYRYYVTQYFGLRWRAWLTNQFVNRWLAKRDYYYLETFDKGTDNPDQRIQEDVGALISYSLSLFTGIISSVTTFIGFIYVLWTLSGTLQIPFGSLGTLYIPGYLVWVALLYSFIGTLITFKIGYPLVGLNFEQQRREANFRFAAIDLRSHAENVALYRGETHQKSILNRLFGRVLDNWYMIILRQKMLIWFTSGFNQVAVILPLVVALPNYFSKVFLLGGVMQSLRAFNSIQEASAFLVNSYTEIAQWRAINQRLTTFLNHLQDIDETVTHEDKVIYHKQDNAGISAKNISIYTPQKQPLLLDINQQFVHGKNYVIKGMSGLGKSTFLKTVAGIWPYAAGEITMPANKKVMFLPQKNYMPLGTLAEAILFPDKSHPEMASQLETVLRDCKLEHLIPRLQETATWSQQLSPGEQQRVGFARILLHKPDWVFLDESTSMLDLSNEEHLYQILKKKLPHCSIVSVGHRPSLDAFHDEIINMGEYNAQPA